MDIGFETPDLQELCEIERVAKRKLGAPIAKQLKNRLADIQAAAAVTDLITGKPHALERERTGQYAVNLVGLFRLTFEPANKPIPKTADDKIDWSKVTKVTVVYIGDYHDY